MVPGGILQRPSSTNLVKSIFDIMVCPRGNLEDYSLAVSFAVAHTGIMLGRLTDFMGLQEKAPIPAPLFSLCPVIIFPDSSSTKPALYGPAYRLWVTAINCWFLRGAGTQ